MVIFNLSLLHKNIKKYTTRRAVRLYGPIFKCEGFVRAVGWHSCCQGRWARVEPGGQGGQVQAVKSDTDGFGRSGNSKA